MRDDDINKVMLIDCDFIDSRANVFILKLPINAREIRE